MGRGLLCAAVLLCGGIAGSRQAPSDSQALYLLAASVQGAPGCDPFSCPADLYSLGRDGKLGLVREIVPETLDIAKNAGVYDVRGSAEGQIYVLSPWDADGEPPVINVIHEDDPFRVDRVNIPGPQAGAAASGIGLSGFLHVGVVHVSTERSDLDFADNLGPDMWNLVRVTGNVVPGQPRIQAGSWSDFQSLEYGGRTFNDVWSPEMTAQVEPDGIAWPHQRPPMGGDKVVLCPLPPRLPPNIQRGDALHSGAAATVIGSDARFFVVGVSPPRPAAACCLVSQLDWDPLTAYVYNKTTGKWSTVDLPTPTDFPQVRIFGDWIATRVSVRSQGLNKVHPGSENERGDVGGGRPDVSDFYATAYAEYFQLTGDLQLRNLADGRVINLRTGQEDSEVVAIRADGMVLYRVNDQLYSARIVNDELTQPSLIVKADGVSEIHWAFWSRARAPVTAGKSRP